VHLVLLGGRFVCCNTASLLALPCWTVMLQTCLSLVLTVCALVLLLCLSWVTQSVAELEVHSRMFDEMGFLPATPHNKINIHVGGTYGDKDAALERFSKVS
jgi:hypothetical protein